MHHHKAENWTVFLSSWTADNVEVRGFLKLSNTFFKITVETVCFSSDVENLLLFWVVEASVFWGNHQYSQSALLPEGTTSQWVDICNSTPLMHVEKIKGCRAKPWYNSLWNVLQIAHFFSLKIESVSLPCTVSRSGGLHQNRKWIF